MWEGILPNRGLSSMSKNSDNLEVGDITPPVIQRKVKSKGKFDLT